MPKKFKDLFLTEIEELDEEMDEEYEDDEVTDDEEEVEVTEETDTTSAEGTDGGNAFDSEEEVLDEEFEEDDEDEDSDNIDVDINTDGSDEGGDEEVEVDGDEEGAVDLDSEDTEPSGDETSIDLDDDDEAEIDLDEVDEETDELNLDEPTDELSDEEDDEEILEVFDDELEGGDEEEDEDLEDEPYMESLKTFEKKINAKLAKLVKEHKAIRKALVSHKKAITENDLYLSKIAVTQRLLSNETLSVKQKGHIIEAIDRAKNYRAVKGIYKVLSESFALGNIGKGINEILKEKVTTSASSVNSPLLGMDSAAVKRMQKLANIPD